MNSCYDNKEQCSQMKKKEYLRQLLEKYLAQAQEGAKFIIVARTIMANLDGYSDGKLDKFIQVVETLGKRIDRIQRGDGKGVYQECQLEHIQYQHDQGLAKKNELQAREAREHAAEELEAAH